MPEHFQWSGFPTWLQRDWTTLKRMNAIRRESTRPNATQRDSTQPNAIRFNPTRFDTTQRNPTRFDTTQRDSTQPNLRDSNGREERLTERVLGNP